MGTLVGARAGSRQRRFLSVSVAGLAVLAASLGVSFLGATGSTAVTVTGGSSAFVYPVATGAALPAAVTALKYTPAADISAAHLSSPVLPSWTPTANAPGGVTNGGDLVVVDAASTNVTGPVLLNVYVTNLAALQLDYSSYALPVGVYSSPCTGGSCTWSPATAVVASPPTYLTSTTGVVSFSLPAGSYYDITLDPGGSYYCTSTSAAGGSLSPSFYFAAQPT